MPTKGSFSFAKIHFPNSMFIFLQNKVSLTKMLQEAALKTLAESEFFDDDRPSNKIIEDDNFEMFEPTVEGKMTLK